MRQKCISTKTVLSQKQLEFYMNIQSVVYIIPSVFMNSHMFSSTKKTKSHNSTLIGVLAELQHCEILSVEIKYSIYTIHSLNISVSHIKYCMRKTSSDTVIMSLSTGNTNA